MREHLMFHKSSVFSLKATKAYSFIYFRPLLHSQKTTLENSEIMLCCSMEKSKDFLVKHLNYTVSDIFEKTSST